MGNDKTVLLDKELQQILEEAEKNSSLEFDFEIPHVEDILKPLEEIQDPERAYTLYYRTYQRLLKKFLPKGEEFKKMNKLIREQGNLYLKEGHYKGRDGKQAKYHRLEKVANVIIGWANRTKGKDLIGLFNELRDLNSGLL